MEVTSADIETFRRECLDPMLEGLCDWWEWVSERPVDHGLRNSPYRIDMEGKQKAGGGIHWRTPYGLYDPLQEGGSSDLDNYLETGSTVGLEKVTNLFPEL